MYKYFNGQNPNSVNPDILPALKSQRDPKTGQLKEDPVFIKHRMDLFDDLFAKQEERWVTWWRSSAISDS